ncbi:hypothetical protein D3C71_1633830 [compost metagenome]
MGLIKRDLAVVIVENARDRAEMAGDVVEHRFGLFRPAGVMAHHEEKAFRQRPHGEIAWHVTGKRPGPFM